MAVQLARICRAIEELAGLPGVPDGDHQDATGGPDGTDADKPDGTAAANAAPGNAANAAPRDGANAAGWAAGQAQAARLAEIWAMLAEADPELAKRVPGYLAATD